MATLPTGTVTFLFTDVAGSTRLWEEDPSGATEALRRHDEIFEAAVEGSGGTVVRPRGEGDSRFAVFPRASDAVTAAITFQRTIAKELPIAVRAALHTGEADVRAGDYYGTAVNRCARLRGIAHGGQTVLSFGTEQMVRDSLPDGASLRDLGEHRLKDLANPEHVFQLCHPDLPGEFPPLASLDRARHNLPVQLTSFVGRNAEVAEVRALLASERLLTLTGAGGAGKTRLALHVAAEVVDAFDDGVWLVDLAAVADPALVPGAFVTALGLVAQAGHDPADLVLEHLADRRVLLVVDNCEHLVAAAASLAERIARRCAGVTVLATSREPLGLPGERAWRVPSLAVPDPGAAPDAIAAAEAVRLFVARAGDPVFALDDRTAPTVSQICARLDGIPLAIELAAARLDVLDVEQVAAKLDDAFTLLTGGSRTALERQQTLRAAVDWSFELLTGDERTLLRRLSVFAGGWTLDGAEEVCLDDALPAERVLDVLSSLARKSLVLVEKGPGGTRYRMLETIRQYARERLTQSGEAAAVRARHRDRFLAFAEAAAAEFHGPGEGDAMRRLDAEVDNLAAALAWSAADPGGAEGLVRFVAALHLFWFTRGMAAEGARWGLLAVERAPSEPTGTLSECIRGAGKMVAQGGDRVGSVELMRRGLDVARQAGDVDREVRALVETALYSRFDEPEASIALDRQAVALARGSGDPQLIATALSGLAHVEHLIRDDYAGARPLYAEALSLFRRTGDRRGVAGVLHVDAFIRVTQGEPAAAIPLFEESAVLFRELDEPLGTIISKQHVALAMLELDRDEDAAPILEEVVAEARARGLPWVVQFTHLNRVCGPLGRRDVEGARPMISEIVALGERLGTKHFNEQHFRAIGTFRRLEGDLRTADEAFMKGLLQERMYGNRIGIIGYVEGFAGTAGEAGDHRRAAVLLGAAAAIRDAIGAPVRRTWRPLYDEDVALARDGLGPDAFRVAWDEGYAMEQDRAIAYALGEEGPL